MLESRLSEIIPLICTSAIWGPYPVFTPWVPLGSPEGVTVVWALIEGRYSSPSQAPSGSLAHTGGLQLLMTVTSLVIDTTGNTTFLSSLLGGSGGAPKRTYNMVLNEWVSKCVSTGSGVCTSSKAHPPALIWGCDCVIHCDDGSAQGAPVLRGPLRTTP